MTTDPPPEPPEHPLGAGESAAPAPTGPAGGTRGTRAAFRRWRRTRPFWATVWTALGGFVILFLPMAPLGKILQVGVGGIAGMAGGVVLMAMALLMLFLPGQRHTAGVIAVIAGVASFPLSNLGGLFAGMVLSVLGGSMAFAWLPEKPAPGRGFPGHGLPRRGRTADRAPGDSGPGGPSVPPVSVRSGSA
ncbi:DUF6114 domain-containing protein [Streptomyces sp. NPDC014891]|uniref:DUF6114 domain-containing protein n=1 Tax=Streptomyces sp. NPDC014891 TaxID=3364929 RepID=UPI0036FB5363